MNGSCRVRTKPPTPDGLGAEYPLPETVTVAGAQVRYGVRGSGSRHLLLVHGSGAHHRWWHAVAPRLENDWRVIQMDLSGHGDSDHREQYDAATWADEVRSVLSAVGARGAVIVGHSMGGRIALWAAAASGLELAGLVLLDVGIFLPDRLCDQPSRPQRSPRRYSTHAAAVERFRLMPPQPPPSAEVLDPVARHSVRPTRDGWTWKHDQRGFPSLYGESILKCVAALTVPVGFVYGENSSLVGDAAAQYVRQSAPTEVTVRRLPAAHHHLMLDAPEECGRLIGELAAAMSPSPSP